MTNFFNKFIDFLNVFRKNNENQEEIFTEERSFFEDFLFFVDENDPAYQSVSLAVELCDGALKIARHRYLLDKKVKEYNVILDEVECYKKLSSDEASYLKELVNKFVALTKERNTLRFQMGDFPPSIDRLETLESQAPEAIRLMEDAERKERILNQDLIYLRQEKENLEAEKENLEFGKKFLYRFNIAMVIIFGVAIMVLAMLRLFRQQIVFVPLTIICFVLIFLVSFVYVFRRRIDYELKLNVKKQIKAVGLINKKTVVYSYYRNFLNYECKKFNVSSSAGLRANLKDYDSYKHITTRYDNIRNIMFQTQKLLENFLREKKIKDINASIESFAKTIDVDDKIAYAKDIAARKSKIDDKIAELDQKHEKIWDELIKLSLKDNTKDKVIERLIKSYLEEVNKISTSENDERLEQVVDGVLKEGYANNNDNTSEAEDLENQVQNQINEEEYRKVKKLEEEIDNEIQEAKKLGAKLNDDELIAEGLTREEIKELFEDI